MTFHIWCGWLKLTIKVFVLTNSPNLRKFKPRWEYHWKLSKLTALALPPTCICRNWSHVQFVSNCVDLTNVRWTPNPRWTAEQSMQINTPYVTLDHVGFLALQSKQTYLEKTQDFILNVTLLFWLNMLTLFACNDRNFWKIVSISFLLGLSAMVFMFY